MIRVVNFPFCNVASITRFLTVRQHSYDYLTDPSIINKADILIIPGVGTFDQGMHYLSSNNFIKPLINHANCGGRIIGICLGMQLLLSSSDESPGITGLSLIPGSCSLIPSNHHFRVPHIGWNSVALNPNFISPATSFAVGVDSLVSTRDFYFVHSYVASASDATHEMLHFQHPNGLQVAALSSGNITGFQFHPEKSGSAGYDLLDAFLK